MEEFDAIKASLQLLPLLLLAAPAACLIGRLVAWLLRPARF